MSKHNTPWYPSSIELTYQLPQIRTLAYIPITQRKVFKASDGWCFNVFLYIWTSTLRLFSCKLFILKKDWYYHLLFTFSSLFSLFSYIRNIQFDDSYVHHQLLYEVIKELTRLYAMEACIHAKECFREFYNVLKNIRSPLEGVEESWDLLQDY